MAKTKAVKPTKRVIYADDYNFLTEDGKKINGNSRSSKNTIIRKPPSYWHKNRSDHIEKK